MSAQHKICPVHIVAYPVFAECPSCMTEEDAADEAKRDAFLDKVEETKE